jgi:hypothetical protein
MNRTSDEINDRTCGAHKADGTSCLVRVPEGGSFCFFHDPTKTMERRAAQARGGQGNRAPSLPVDAPEFAPETVGDLVPPLVATINGVLRGQITASVGTTVCNLVNSLMKALGDRDLEQRLWNLEQAARKSNTETGLFDPDAEQPH